MSQSNETGKPRGWTIQHHGNSFWDWIFVASPQKDEKDYDGIHPKLIHLVEEKHLETLQNQIEQVKKELAAANEKLEIAKEGLKFYADEKNWWGVQKDRTDSVFKSDLELLYKDTLHGGKTARKTLEKIEENK